MATLVNLSGFTYGFATGETSCEMRSLSTTTTPQFKTYLPDKVNNHLGFALGAGRQEVTLTADLSASSAGILAFTFSTACTIANETDHIDNFGVTTGGFYMDSATVNVIHDGFKNVSISLSRDVGVA